MTRLRAGVIGAGAMGAHHARAYATLAESDLVGVYDPDSERARSVAERFDAAAFDDLDALLQRVDVVSIA
ncbi:MAG TPA: Gfo/Idh/MocA family oxidoreductase, partial [Solirubrobacteraceae bacterium]